MNESTSNQTKKLLSKEDVKDAALFGAEFIPGVGEALAIKRTSDALDKGDYIGAGIEATAGLLGLVPGVGDLAGKGLRTASKAFRKADVDEAEKLVDNPDKLKEWQEANTLPESQRQKNIPEAEQAAEDLFQGNIKSKEARKRIKEVFPEPELYTAETMPEMPTVTDVVGSMGKKSEKGILGVKGFDLEPGQRVGARLDIPAYNKYDKWVVSIHDGKSAKGSVVGYGQAIRLKNITFGSDPKIALDIARRKVIKEADPVKGTSEKRMGKATIARVFGDYVPEDPYELQEFAQKILADKDSSWTQVGMNPYRGSYFYDKATGTPVTRADEVIQVGPLVLAKNVTKPKMSELKEMFKPVARTAEGKLRIFNEGGAVPMNKPIQQQQLELFEGAGKFVKPKTKKDPISGNPVPKASVPEEVRDDIPAQLSEGEFVLPADVVRYHGLEKLMKLRQQAKTGINMMDNMGQLGNAEEATMRDDMPFTPNMQMQTGGAVMQPTITQPQTMTQIPNVAFQGGQNVQSQFAGATPGITVPTAPTYTQVSTAPQYRVPTQQDPATFQDLTGTKPGQLQEYETIKYINPETKEELFIPFIGSEPIYPIPNGFVRADSVEEDATQQDPTTGVQTTQTTQQDGGDEESTATTTTTRLTEFLDKEDKPKEKGTLASTLTDPRRIAGSVIGNTLFGLPGAILGGIVASGRQDKAQQGEAVDKVVGFDEGQVDPRFRSAGDLKYEVASQQAYGRSYAEMTKIFSGNMPTFKYGSDNGDVDRTTGGTYVNGMAVDENGDAAKTPNGTFSYASFSDWADHLKAGSESGWRGGVVGARTYANMSPTARANYDKYASIMGYTQGGQGSDSDDSAPPGTGGIVQAGAPIPGGRMVKVGNITYVSDPSDPAPRTGSPAPTTTTPGRFTDPRDDYGSRFGGGEFDTFSPGVPTGRAQDDIIASSFPATERPDAKTSTVSDSSDDTPSTGTSFTSGVTDSPEFDADRSSSPSPENVGFGGDDFRSFKEGGLAQQMKRSGLASKK